MFKELQSIFIDPPPRELKANSWISTNTWKLIDRVAMSRKWGMLNQQGIQQLGRKIKASMNSDRKTRAVNVANKIEGHLLAGEPRDACRCMKG